MNDDNLKLNESFLYTFKKYSINYNKNKITLKNS